MNEIWVVEVGLTGENIIIGVFSTKRLCDEFYEKFKLLDGEAVQRQYNFNPDPAMLDDYDYCDFMC